MQHPDGHISFFNDSSIGIAPDSKYILRYAKSLGIVYKNKLKKNYSKYLQDSGYICLSRRNIKLIIDFGNLGPDYLLAHSHADTLSFELSLFKQRFIVNGGISTYDNLEDREIERSSKSHSTIIHKNENSSDTWSYFRVAKELRLNQYQLKKVKILFLLVERTMDTLLYSRII